MVQSRRWLTVRLIANELNIDQDNVWKVFIEELDMRKVCTKIVIKVLNDDQKNQHMQLFKVLFKLLETKLNQLWRIIRADVMDLRVRLEDKTPEPLVEEFDVTKAKENTTFV